eukprot:235334-Hanusia_phi.AAC.3
MATTLDVEERRSLPPFLMEGERRVMEGTCRLEESVRGERGGERRQMKAMEEKREKKRRGKPEGGEGEEEKTRARGGAREGERREEEVWDTRVVRGKEEEETSTCWAGGWSRRCAQRELKSGGKGRGIQSPPRAQPLRARWGSEKCQRTGLDEPEGQREKERRGEREELREGEGRRRRQERRSGRRAGVDAAGERQRGG